MGVNGSVPNPVRADKGSWAVKHCLIVDDSAVIRKVARRILDGVGFYVSEASSGAEGWRLCRNTMPDIVMLDHVLPDMTAIEFIESLRKTGKLPRILLCTPFLDVPRIMKAKRAGATGYVMKPFNRAQLLTSFEHQLTQARAA
jgi:two-component system, chemotaxis family, chemotaxis protein CheY